jgi:hypothetical protein
LLGKLGYSQGAVLLAAFGSEGGKPWHEEVETRERNHVDSKLPKVGIELARETKAGSDSRHGQRNQMIEITVGRSGEFESAEADIIQGFVIDAKGLVGVLDQLMHGESGVVRLDNSVRDLGRWYNGVGVHDPVRILLSDL